MNESGAKKTAQGNKLATCKATLEEANSNLFHCNREVCNRCHLMGHMLRDHMVGHVGGHMDHMGAIYGSHGWSCGWSHGLYGCHLWVTWEVT